LPYVEYDLGYGTNDWRWRFERGPLMLRVLTSFSPRWPIAPAQVSPEATRDVNARLLATLVDTVEQDGAIPLMVYMSELRSAMAVEALALARVRYLEVAPCLTAIPANQKKVASGNHYTGVANAAIAGCTAPAVERALRGIRDPS
jgi:hypothetical protein